MISLIQTVSIQPHQIKSYTCVTFNTEGALKGFEGRVKKVLRHKRLAVLEMPLMGRTVEVTVGLGIVERRQRGGE